GVWAWRFAGDLCGGSGCLGTPTGQARAEAERLIAILRIALPRPISAIFFDSLGRRIYFFARQRRSRMAPAALGVSGLLGNPLHRQMPPHVLPVHLRAVAAGDDLA